MSDSLQRKRLVGEKLPCLSQFPQLVQENNKVSFRGKWENHLSLCHEITFTIKKTSMVLFTIKIYESLGHLTVRSGILHLPLRGHALQGLQRTCGNRNKYNMYYYRIYNLYPYEIKYAKLFNLQQTSYLLLYNRTTGNEIFLITTIVGFIK